MKKLLLTLSLCAASFAYADAGYYLTIQNDSNADLLVTGKDGGGNSCWHSGDFADDSKGTVRAHSSKTLYSSLDSTGGCALNAHSFYQGIQLKPTYGAWHKFTLGWATSMSSRSRSYITYNYQYNGTTKDFSSYGPWETDTVYNGTFRGTLQIDSDGNVGAYYMAH